MPQSNQAEEPATSVTALAIQPPVQLSAVTSICRAASRRAPVACESASSSASVGTIVIVGSPREVQAL